MHLTANCASGIEGSRVLLDEHSLLSAAGNALSVTKIPSGEQVFVPVADSKRGIDLVAGSNCEGIYAYSNRAPAPVIFVCDKDHVVIKRLEDGSQLGYSAIGISRDNSRLVSVGAFLEREIIVWCLKTGKELCRAVLGSRCCQVSFSPFDSSVICTSGTDGSSIWNVKDNVNCFGILKVDGISNEDIGCHAWSREGFVYILSKESSQILSYDVNRKQVARNFLLNPTARPCASSNTRSFRVSSIECTKDFIVTGCSDGTVRWFEIENLFESQCKVIHQDVPIVYLKASLQYDSILVGSREGMWSTVSTSHTNEDTPVIVGDYHTDAVLGVAPVYSIRNELEFFVSISGDDTFRIWRVGNGRTRLVTKCKIAAPENQNESLSAIASSSHCGFTAIGTVRGLVKMMNVYKTTQGEIGASCLQTLKVHDSCTDMLAFNPTGSLLASGSQSENALSIFRVSLSLKKSKAATLSAIVELPSPPVAMQWKNNSLLVATNNDTDTVVYQCNISKDDSKDEEDAVQRLELKILYSVPCSTSNFGAFVFLPSQKILTSTGDRVFKVHCVANKSTAQLEFRHEGNISCTATHGSLFSSGAADGSISIWNDAEKVSDIQESENFLETPCEFVSSICFSAAGDSVIAGHRNGSISVVNLGLDPSSAKQNPSAVMTLDERPSSEVIETLTEMNRWKEKEQEELRKESESKRSERRVLINSLQQRLQDLLERNNSVPELEKLDREEFVIDLRGRDNVGDKYDKLAISLREKFEREIKGRDLIYSRIKKECWDSTKVPFRQVRGLDQSIIVSNFALPEISPEEQEVLNHVYHLRRIELAGGKGEQRKVLKLLSPEADWLVNTGLLLPNLDLHANIQTTAKEEVRKEENVEEASEEDSESSLNEDLDSNNAWSIVDMLYNPLVVRSCIHKRSQIILLKQLQREIMIAMNKCVEKLVDEKEDTMERISAKFQRVNEINEELSQPISTARVSWSDSEKVDSLFNISDSEIGVTKYLSRAEREKQALEAEEKRRRAAEAAKDNMGARALEDMMKGTLENVKEPTLAEKEMVKPEWMLQVTYADMTEEQRREFDEFDTKFQQFMESKEKYSKALEIEHKKCLQEATELMISFDNALLAVRKLKMDVVENILVQESYRSRLVRGLTLNEDTQLQRKKLEQELENANKELQEAEKEISDFASHLVSKKESVHRLQESDRTEEKSFKNHMQDLSNESSLDTDLIRILLQLYKQRESKKPDTGLLRTNSNLSGIFRRNSLDRRNSFTRTNSMESRESLDRRPSMGHISRTNSLRRRRSFSNSFKQSDEDPPVCVASAMDPYHGFQTSNKAREKAEARRIATMPLDLEFDWPSGVVQDLEVYWEAMQTLRVKKINLELDLADEVEALNDVVKHHESLTSIKESIALRIEHVESSLSELSSMDSKSLFDAEICVRVRQGLIEVKSQNGFSDSLLLGRSVIENENAKIIELGKSKVAVLTKMKDFRKNINYLDWEHRYLMHQGSDMEEHFTDLHMLRVTKSLQEIIKGGETGERHDEVQQCEVKMSKMKSINMSKVAKLTASMEKVQQKQQHLKEENLQLEERLKELSTNVSMRDTVLLARHGKSILHPEEEESKSSKSSSVVVKMKNIVKRRKMVDLAKAQNDEIQFLTQELERLRERNFPKFSNPSSAFAEKEFIRYPDEM